MLRITLCINAQTIADYEVRRVTHKKSQTHDDQVNAYTISEIPDLRHVGTVAHRYGDGAHVLAAAALTKIEEARR